MHAVTEPERELQSNISDEEHDIHLQYTDRILLFVIPMISA